MAAETKEADIIMYIIINEDLKMSKGKCIAQACHVTQKITEEIIRKSYESPSTPEECLTYMKWRTNCTKVILKTNFEQLLKLSKLPEARYMVDIINTKECLTAVGFFPSNKMAKEFEAYKKF
ncbi:MAG: peptidyl-tRNA hydrolase [Hyperionvirus sp.]|uniref:peptidyl-tRNA hydrolase n=1 Tax=Hyperionvirus sp. TaxID=2487770 RepID=A0A3G5A841_9VIRU|nr:MAG: peptidyl-tRNA hydrolase [Hyperionvirus sp.]